MKHIIRCNVLLLVIYLVLTSCICKKKEVKPPEPATPVEPAVLMEFKFLTLNELSGNIGSTKVYRADFSDIDLTEIAALIIYDSSQAGDGYAGDRTGADIDAIKISTSLCNSASEVIAAPEAIQLDFSQNGTIYKPGFQEEPFDSTFLGADPTGRYLDNNKANLSVFQGSQTSNYLSLGRGGALYINLPPATPMANLYLYIGEVAGNETIAAMAVSKALDTADIMPTLKNIFNGSCEELLEYHDNHGVTDGYGVNHPGYSGWTDFQVRGVWETGPLSQRQVTTTVTRYNCPCNSTVYDELEDCLENCEVTLGCFTGICEPIYSDEEQVCVKVEAPVKVKFLVDTRVNQIYWLPPIGASVECIDEIIRWREETKDHEEKHVSDINAIVDAANASYAGEYSFTEEGCGSNVTQATNDLKNKIGQAIKNEADNIKEDIRRSIEEFDSSPEGKITLPDCSKCPAL